MRKVLLALIATSAIAFGTQAGATNIEHVGSPRFHEPASSGVSMNSDLMGAARVLAPTGWTGFAQRQLDTRRQSSVSIQQGEPWVAALDRWLAQEQLTARLDWQSKRFYLNPGRVPVQAGGQINPSTWAPAPVAVYSAPAAPAAPAVAQAESWDIDLKDIHLGNTFTRWGAKQGWTVLWDAPKNIMIEATSTFGGTLTEAINQVLRSPGIQSSAFPLEACVYPNTPPLIRITLKGEQEAECK